MQRKRSKGQGLVEFALTLPILLLLILGILEMGRVVWAYITVQAAARDAARYAITGRPYIELANVGGSNSPGGACTNPDNAADAEVPWLCEPVYRAEAVKFIARERGATLVGGVSDPAALPACESGEPETLNLNVREINSWDCDNQPGYFAVHVVGQTTEPASPPIVLDDGSIQNFRYIQQLDYAGDEGLNVLVKTSYNVEMLTPIFQTLIGTAITVRGQAQMQNEGVNPVVGNEPPPPIEITQPSPNAPQPTCFGDDCPSDDPVIESLTGYEDLPAGPGGVIDISLDNHERQGGPYRIFIHTAPNDDGSIPSGVEFQRFELCAEQLGPGQNGFNTGGNGNLVIAGCDLSEIPVIPGEPYCLYSIEASANPSGINCAINPVARSTTDVTFSISDDARLFVRRGIRTGTEWSARSEVDVILSNHDAAETYNIFMITDGGTETQINTTAVPVAEIAPDTTQGNAIWTVPPGPTSTDYFFDQPDADPLPAAGQSPCPSSAPCLLESRQLDGTPVASSTLTIIEPTVTVIGGVGPYNQGQTVNISISDHNVGETYDLYVEQFITATGQYEVPAGLGLDGGIDISSGNQANLPITDEWPNGTYRVGTYPDGVSVAQLDSDWIAAPRQLFEVLTINTPFLQVDGEDDRVERPIGSDITIDMYNHDLDGQTTTSCRVDMEEVGGSAVYEVENVSGDTVFIVNAEGRGTVANYEIPASAAISGNDTLYELVSYCTNGSGVEQEMDRLELLVLSQALIRAYLGNSIDEADRVDEPDRQEGDALDGGSTAILPDSEITVRLIDHAPNTDYDVYYAGKQMLINPVTTDGTGEASFVYQMEDLPTSPLPDLTNPTSWGQYYELYSTEEDSAQRIATTTLGIDAVNLSGVSAVLVSSGNNPNIQEGAGSSFINQAFEVDFTFENTSSLNISRTFDIDFYQNSGPLTPFDYQQFTDYNPPGDYKQWENFVGANSAFVKRQAFTLTSYGVHTFYAQVDTSNLVDELSETDNVLQTTLTLSCNAGDVNLDPTFASTPGSPQTITDGFDTDTDTDPAGWEGYSRIPGRIIGSLSTNGGLLSMLHNKGSVSAVVDQTFQAVYNTELTDLNYVEVDVVAAPTTNEDDYLLNRGGAGLALKIADPRLDGDAAQIYIYLVEQVDGSGYDIGTGYRLADQTIDSQTAGVTIPPSQLPVTLRIERVGLNFQLKYATNGGALNTVRTMSNAEVSDVTNQQDFFVALFATRDSTENNDPSGTDTDQSETTFDNFAYQFTTENLLLDDWQAYPYGNVDDSLAPEVQGSNLVLSTDGLETRGGSDNGTNSYYYFGYEPTGVEISTESGFQVRAVIDSIARDGDTDLPGSRIPGAGIEIRNNGGNTASPKIQFMVSVADVDMNGTFEYYPYAVYRNSNGTILEGSDLITDFTELGGSGATLRVTRDDVIGINPADGTVRRGIFKFYVGNRLVGSIQADDIEGAVSTGLFNVSGETGVYQRTTFSNFDVTYKSCNAGNAEASLQTGELLIQDTGIPVNPPPGLQLCYDGIQNGGFENNASGWRINAGGGTELAEPGRGGTSIKMAGDTSTGGNPFFYQQIDIGSWILTNSTTLSLDFYKNINDTGNDASSVDQNDIFKAVIVENPPANTDSFIDELGGELDTLVRFTDPIEITNGEMNDLTYNPNDWEYVSQQFPLVPGADLENPPSTLYLLVYNSSNGQNCEFDDTCKSTEFFFDDMALSTCTTNPRLTNSEINALPSPTHIQGRVDSYLDIGGTVQLERYAGLQVWAYTIGGELYRTTTIQNGEFNFYGLPATPAGTTYYLYAEQIVTQGDEVSVLGNEAQPVILRSTTPNNLVSGVVIEIFDIELD